MNLPLDDLRSVRVPDAARLAAVVAADSIVIIGSACSGKTTLVDAIRASDLFATSRVDVPARLITRAARAGDNLVENQHVSDDELDAERRSGRVSIVWTRRLGGRTVRYAFRPARPGTFAVYSANNALVAPGAEVEPRGAIGNALVVGVYADDPIREQRMRQRSPDLWERPDELADRLGEPAASVASLAHLVVENQRELESRAPRDLLELVRVLEARRNGD